MRTLLFFCIVLSNVALAQSVSISPNQGVKFPQYSTANMLAIASPENGSTVFNIETNTLWTYLGSGWKNLGSGVNGTKMQTFIFNNLSWALVTGVYSRTYTAIVTITELNVEVLNSGIVDVAYVPLNSNTVVFRKLPEPDWGLNPFTGTYYTIIKAFSYETNAVSLMVQIPGALSNLNDAAYLPQQVKITLITPDPNN